MPEPRITTILPTYRRPEMLRRAIKSVLAQTYPHLKVMVLDNASGDETQETVAALMEKDSRVAYHCHDENLGSLKNFLYGMESVDTPCFAFLSDDDVLLPHCYEVAMQGFEECPDAGFAGGLTVETDPLLNPRPPVCYKWALGRNDPPGGAVDMLKNYHPNWTSLVFKSDMLRELGYIDGQMRLVQDVEYTVRIALHYPFYISPRPCALFTCHPGSFSGTRDATLSHEASTRWIEKIRSDPVYPENLKVELEEIMQGRFRSEAKSAVVSLARRRRFDEAAGFLDMLGKQSPGAGGTRLLRFGLRLGRSMPTFLGIGDMLWEIYAGLRRKKQFREWEGYAELMQQIDRLRQAGEGRREQ